MADRTQIRQTLVDLIETDIGERYDNLVDSTNLRTELGMDSVDVVSIVSQIERHFRIRLTHQELETLMTVGDLLNLLETKVSTPSVNTAAA